MVMFFVMCGCVIIIIVNILVRRINLSYFRCDFRLCLSIFKELRLFLLCNTV